MKKLNLVCEECGRQLEYFISSDRKEIKVCLCKFCRKLIESESYSYGYETACEDE